MIFRIYVETGTFEAPTQIDKRCSDCRWWAKLYDPARQSDRVGEPADRQ